MSDLLEILGRGIVVDTADLIWHWLNVVSLPPQFNDPQRHQRLSRVVDLVADNKPSQAAEQLRFYLFDHPDCIHGRMAAAALCIARNRPADAVEELNSVYCRRPNNTMALYALGHCYERLHKEPDAVAFYQDCLKFKNYLELPAQRLAAIYFKNGRTDRTIEQYELIRDQYPDDIAALCTLGHLYILAGRAPEAVDVFNKAILIHPDNFMGGDENINELLQAGQWQEAVEVLDDMLAEHPDRADLMMKRADVLSMLGSTEEAIEQYEQALRTCPDFLEATIKLGTQYLRVNQEQLAARQFNAAVEINDKIVDAYIGLALSQKIAGKKAEALATLSLAAAIEPNSAFLFGEVANLIFAAASDAPGLLEPDSAQQTTEAVIEAHRRQIERQPQNPDLYHRLGMLMMGSGRLDTAADLFAKALEINPTFTRACNKRIICLHETGRQEQALECLIPCAQLDPQTLDLHYKTALLYCDKIKFASSLLNLDRYMEDNFARADAAVNISVVLQNLGLLDRVAAMWDSLTDTANRASDANLSE